MDQNSETNQPQQQPPATGVTLSRPMIISIVYLLNIVLGFSVLVGVVLAYVWRGDEASQEWEKTHFTYMIRTFWIGAVLFIVSMVIFFGSFFASIPPAGSQPEPPSPMFFITFFGMFAVWMAMAAWFCVRCVLSMVKASNGQPMPRPKTFLF